VITPNCQFLDVSNRNTRFLSDLGQRTVVVKTQHCGEVFRWKVWSRFHRDISVGGSARLSATLSMNMAQVS
jgi:hypothetical protein